jgi:acyl dehydratase
VEAGHILTFARAIGDPNPIYSNESYAARSKLGGVIAPPTFIQAADHFDPDFDRRPRPGEPWIGSAREPMGVDVPPGFEPGGASAFHAEQHFEYHRPLRPGDVLNGETRDGRTWHKQGRRGGRLTFDETITDYRDEQGELVVTSRFVSVRAERSVGR